MELTQLFYFIMVITHSNHSSNVQFTPTQAIVVLTDRLTWDANERRAAQKDVIHLEKQHIRMFPIAIGRNVKIRELQKISNGKEVPMFGEYEDHKKVGMKIIHGELELVQKETFTSVY